MNTNRSEAILLASHIVASTSGSKTRDILVCVPSLHLADVSKLLANSQVKLGAQNAHWLGNGAVTGEISISMLKDYQVEYVLIGHSERREMFAESDDIIALKFEAALKYGIIPLLCVGESLQQREAGSTIEVLTAQCAAVVDKLGIKAFANAVVAYEPIWAIGTGKTASPQQAQEVHQALRAWFAQQDSNIAANLQILYGGSMNGENAEQLLEQMDIDGGLIGGASLKAEEFLHIVSAAG